MFNKANKMTKISHFLIMKNSTLTVFNNFLFVNSQKFEINPMLIHRDITNDNVWIKDNYWDNYLLIISKKSLIKLDFNIGLNGTISNVLIIFKDSVLSCFSTIDHRIIVNFPIVEKIKTYLSNQNNLFFQVETTLKSLSLLTGEYEWEVDLSEKLGVYDSIAKIAGVVDEVLWVISQRGILFGIEINTGELLYHLNYDHVDSFKETGKVNAKYYHSLFDEANKKLIGIYRTQCWEIDLTNPTTGLQVFDLEAINPTYFSHPDFYFRGSYWAAPEGVTFDEDYLYFRDVEVATVGVMSRKTKKIEWHTRLNDQEPMVRDVINDIQVSDNKLYVLDTGGNLHIFEREE